MFCVETVRGWRRGGYNVIEKNTGGQFFIIEDKTGVRLGRDMFLSDKMFTSY